MSAFELIFEEEVSASGYTMAEKTFTELGAGDDVAKALLKGAKGGILITGIPKLRMSKSHGADGHQGPS